MKKNIFITLFIIHTIGLARAQLNDICFMIPDVQHVQTMNASSYTALTIDVDSTVITIDSTPIYWLAVSGDITLTSSQSFIRIILVDNQGVEYLVYEINDLLTDTNQFSIIDIGRETLWSEAIIPTRLVVRLNDATLTLTSINKGTNILPESMPALKKSRTEAQNDTIINTLNRQLVARDIPWRAGLTEIATQTYNVRRAILGDNSPFHNLEYFVGGYYVDPAFDPANSPAIEDAYVPEFDWRNRHGRNWITPIKRQQKNDCWAFAAIATGESYINLYFNKLLNIDLSEQQMEAVDGSSFENGGFINDAMQYMTEENLVTENCYPYGYISYLDTLPTGEIHREWEKIFTERCENPDTTFKFDNTHTIGNLNKITKSKQLILNAPFAMDVSGMWHVMSCIGYKTIEAGDTIHIDSDITSYHTPPIIISETSPYLGQNAWLLKNSYAWYISTAGNWSIIYDHGIRYMIIDESHILSRSSYFTGKVFSNIFTDDDVVIEDRDGDGYYFWGIGEKPAHCPAWVPDIPDGNDADPRYGPMDEFGYLQEIGPDNCAPTIITKDTTWSTPQLIQGNLRIRAGVTLTVKNHLTIHKDAQIIVEGGRLIVDGGTIHNGCILNQGSIILRNNGIVELRNDDRVEHAPDLPLRNTATPPFPIELRVDYGEIRNI